MMFVVTGANGQTGSVVAQTLLEHGHEVRVVVRRHDQARKWFARGASAVVADLGDAAAMRGAFEGVAGAYLMNPPSYTSEDIFAAARNVHSILIREAERANVPHIVALSSVGAQHASGTGNILTTHDLERQLASSPLRSTVLRAANFMDNWLWSTGTVQMTGELPSMLLPLDRALPMVAASDVGRSAADLLIEGASAPGLLEVQGPCEYSPADAAAALFKLLGRQVCAVAVREEQWPDVFHEAGFSRAATEAFCEMYRGFNSGLVSFSGEGVSLCGRRDLTDVLAAGIRK